MKQEVILNADMNDIVKAKIKKIKEIKSQIEALDKQYKGLVKDVINFMGTNEELRDTSGLLWCTNKTYATTRFDTTSFREDHPDVYCLYSKTSDVSRFSIKI